MKSILISNFRIDSGDMESGRGWKDKHCKICISVGKNRAREECSRRSETDISGIFKIYVSVDKK